MQINVLEYLEKTVEYVPDDIAFSDGSTSLTFKDVFNKARAIGTFLSEEGFYKKPIVVYMKRCPETIAAFLGAVYAGCHYVPADDEMPHYRIELMLSILDAGAVICDETTLSAAGELNYGKVYLYEDISNYPVNVDKLAKIRQRHIDTDPFYVVFTSGSSGIPKGVIASHRSVITYIEHLCEILKPDRDTVFGNQAPLSYDASMKEIYPTLKYGLCTYIIPKQLFMFPIKLVEFLNLHHINTICWVPSALAMISAFNTFEKVKPLYLRIVTFAGEVFPIKQFNIWRETLPDVRFVNFYGPTECTGVCCWYEAERIFAPDERIPIGRPFTNTDIILLDENNTEPNRGMQGEICVRGTSLAHGYYRDPERTAKAFVQNPLNDLYPEVIYRTGDLGRYNERGELMFVSRKDNLIKHMGHRIEMSEIEAAVNICGGVRSACCLYDDENKKIVLYYEGDISEKEAFASVKEKLPRYMMPNAIIKLKNMPLTANGKIDRRYLTKMFKEKIQQ